MINYIKQLNIFNEIARAQEFSVQAQLIYYKLLDIWNRAGRPKYIKASNMRLILEAQTRTEHALIKARKELISASIIKYTRGHKGVPNRYEILDLEKSRQTFNPDYFLDEDENCTSKKGSKKILTVASDSQSDSISCSENDSINCSQSCSQNFDSNSPKNANNNGSKTIEMVDVSNIHNIKDGNTLTVSSDSVNDSIYYSENDSQNDSQKNNQQKCCLTVASDSQSDSQSHRHNRVRVRGTYSSVIPNTTTKSVVARDNELNNVQKELSFDAKKVLEFLSSHLLVDGGIQNQNKAIELTNEYGREYTISALELALKKKQGTEGMNYSRVLAYAEGVLMNWRKDGFKAVVKTSKAKYGNNIAMDSLARIINGEDD